MDLGPFRLVEHTPGLRIVLERNPRWRPKPFLKRIVIFFVQSLDIAIELLRTGRLDAAALPSSVNLDERLAELDLPHDTVLGYESIALRFNDDLLDLRERRGIAGLIDRQPLTEGFVRDDGRITDTLRPAPCCASGFFGRIDEGGRPPKTLRLAAPDGDELLSLMQRALQVQLRSQGTRPELISIPASTLYAEWRVGSPVEAMLVRTAGTKGLVDPPTSGRRLTAVPIAHVETVVAWRPGVHGIVANGTLAGPLHNAAEWWKDAEI